MATKTTKPAFPAWLIVLYLLSAAAIMVGGMLYYRSEGRRMRAHAVNQLTAVAQLKVGQIVDWRKSKIKEANMISDSTFLVRYVDEWIRDNNSTAEKNLRYRIEKLSEDLSCSNVLIVDSSGNMRLSYKPTIRRLQDVDVETRKAFRKVEKTGRPVITDLSLHSGKLNPHFHIIAPLFRDTGTGRRFVGAIMLVEDAHEVFFPMVQSWPALSRSAETLLVTRDDGSVLFLNDLRFKKNTALKLRIPLSKNYVPAVKAVTGGEGVFEGRDYRGVEVVSVLKSVPGTSWKMISKMDSAEIFETKNRQMLLLAVLMLLLLTGSFLLISGFWQSMQKRHFKEAYEAGLAREAVEKHFEYLIKYANDIILLSGDNGKIEMANDRALEATGFTRNEITDMSVMELVRTESANALIAEYEVTSEKGASIFDMDMKAKDGRCFPVEVSMRAIEVGGRRYFQAIIRDVTERKAAEEALKLSEERMAATLFSIGDGVISTDAAGNVMVMNTVAERLTGWMIRDAAGRSVTEVFNIVNMFSRKSVENPVEKVLREGRIVGLANHTVLISKDGREYQIADSGAPIKTADGRIIGVVLVFRDVTKEYWMRDEINRNEQRYRNLVEFINTCVVVYEAVDGGSDFIIREFNSAAERAEKVSKEQLTGRRVTEAFPGIVEFGLLDLLKKVWETGVSEFMPDSLYKDGRIEGWRRNYIYKLPSGEIVSVYEDVSERVLAEQKLMESEERYRLLFKNSPFGIWQTDCDRNFIGINPAFAEMFGFKSPEEMFKKTSEIRSHYLVPSERDELYRLLAVQGEVRNYEVEQTREDGSRIWVLMNAKAIRDENGDVRYYEGTVEDITERRRAQVELEEKEEQLRLVFDSAGEAILILTDKMQIVACNPAGVRLFGYETENDVAMNAPLFVSPELQPGGGRSIDKVNGIINDVKVEGNRQFEWVNVKKDGAEFPSLISLSLMKMKGKEFLQATIHDLTARKRAETELQSERDRLKTILDNINIGIYIGDKDCSILYANPSLIKDFGPFENKKCHSYFHGLEGVCSWCRSDEVLTGNQYGWESDELVNGRTYDIFNMPLKNSDGSPSKLVVMRDVTDMKTAEEERRKLEDQLSQARKLESVGQLAGGIAHDFNNMLTPILGYAEMMLNDLPEGHPHRSDTEQIMKAAESARDLTRQLLAFARKQTLDVKPVNLNKVIDKFRKMLRRTIRENVIIETKLAESIGLLKGDIGQIEQIILNLAVNAQDAMPEGGTLTIETSEVEMDGAADESGGKYVLMAVSDNGTGMEKDILEKVFDPFFTTKERGRGTGLGLSTVYGIVRQHRGLINAYSEPGLGTTIKVYFPAISGKEQSETSVPSEEAPRGTETILVVEDMPEVRKMAVELLERQGYSVLQAACAREALEIIFQFKGTIHLVITDVIMPDMNGRELYESLVMVTPGLKVIYMSGYTENVLEGQINLDSNVHYIQKPFAFHVLANKVREALDGV